MPQWICCLRTLHCWLISNNLSYHQMWTTISKWVPICLHSTKRIVVNWLCVISFILVFVCSANVKLNTLNFRLVFWNMQRKRKQIHETMTTDTLIDFTTCANVSGYRIHLISHANRHKPCATNTHTNSLPNAVIQKDTVKLNLSKYLIDLCGFLSHRNESNAAKCINRLFINFHFIVGNISTFCFSIFCGFQHYRTIYSVEICTARVEFRCAYKISVVNSAIISSQ